MPLLSPTNGIKALKNRVKYSYKTTDKELEKILVVIVALKLLPKIVPAPDELDSRQWYSNRYCGFLHGNYCGNGEIFSWCGDGAGWGPLVRGWGGDGDRWCRIAVGMETRFVMRGGNGDKYLSQSSLLNSVSVYALHPDAKEPRMTPDPQKNPDCHQHLTTSSLGST